MINRNIDADKVLAIANELIPKMIEASESESFPGTMTIMEFILASYVAARHALDAPKLPSDIHLDEFVASYKEFVKLCEEDSE